MRTTTVVRNSIELSYLSALDSELRLVVGPLITIKLSSYNEPLCPVSHVSKNNSFELSI